MKKKYMNCKTTEEKVKTLLSEMTLEEKIGQLHLNCPSMVGGFGLSVEEMYGLFMDGKIDQDELNRMLSEVKEEFNKDEVRRGGIGAFIGTYGAEKLNEIQRVAVEESRLGIPLLFGFDTIHGHQTIFPIPLAESCTWDRECWYWSARWSALEAAATGINWVFAPMLDVARDARWGRIAESAGEDTFLTSIYAEEKVKGFQGKNLKETDSVLACPKHFVAYGACEGGRDYNTAEVSEQTLHEVYLPPFKAAIEAGAETIMPAFNDVMSVPCTSSPYLLRKVLRDQYGFEGFTVSDANAVAELVNHGIAENRKDAARMAVSAGLNVDMGSSCYLENLEELIQEGRITVEQLDEAVSWVLKVKFDKGLFEHPYISNADKEKQVLDSDRQRMAARKVAEKSIVLLKNETNILPLDISSKIAVVGTLADSAADMNGSWALATKTEQTVTVYEGIKEVAESVVYAPCCGVEGDFDREETDKAIYGADVIVAVVGEDVQMSGEAASRTDISLPGQQERFISYLLETGKPVICILVNGRPLAIPYLAENVAAIVEAWQLGTEGGRALANILFGKVNPSGRLTTTFPSSSGQCPAYYSGRTTGKPAGNFKFTSKYIDAPLKPIYPFGFGLSYTEFRISDLKAVLAGENVSVTVWVKNIGKRKGTETIQVYVKDMVASCTRPNKLLKGFSKVELNPEEEKKIEIMLPVSSLGFFDSDNLYVVEPGKFKIWAGKNSEDLLETEIEIY